MSDLQGIMDEGTELVGQLCEGLIGEDELVAKLTFLLGEAYSLGNTHGLRGKVGNDTQRCPDCGEEGEQRGHVECQYPQGIPDDEGLEDPMLTER